ncbi:uncharacterized protein BDZ99DRAFT_474179 [Mytilinidion resinicola]|uniref:Uncharacterized protein n=1 Tax=Mytilinidion resinicola TaxID=574789 RepID=A0A6A6YX81_9PEZI|nr:uncharacterized protein BDZ99DRAFT_474179 [Mytilinidion resinicola]KAF2813546.1 hypothetical protein BDZ99DRAFT_474179 [Mytilinidion resinicola]
MKKPRKSHQGRGSVGLKIEWKPARPQPPLLKLESGSNNSGLRGEGAAHVPERSRTTNGRLVGPDGAYKEAVAEARLGTTRQADTGATASALRMCRPQREMRRPRRFWVFPMFQEKVSEGVRGRPASASFANSYLACKTCRRAVSRGANWRRRGDDRGASNAVDHVARNKSAGPTGWLHEVLRRLLR